MTGSTRYQWIGKIPSDWEILKISHTTYVKGRIGWHGLNTEEFIDEGPYCVTGTDLKDGTVDWSSCYHVSEERYDQDPYIQLKESDLLLTKDGTIGKCGIVVGLDGKATLNSGLFVIRPEKDSYMTRFLYWIIQSQVFDNFITLTKTGTTISHLYQNVFEGFRFPVPTIKTQKQIADFLDKETTRIDTLISKKQKQIELLQEKRQAIITQSVTKGLNENVKMKDSGVEWIGEIPEHWRIYKLKHLSRIKTGTTPNTESIDIEGDILWYTPGDFSDELELGESSRKVQQEEKSTMRIFSPYTVLLVSIGATLGKVSLSIDECSSNQQINGITTSEKLDPYYLLFFLLSFKDVIREQSNSTTLGILNQEKTGNIQISIPSIDEQKVVVEHMQNQWKKSLELKSTIQKSIDLLKEYRSSLITHAVSGQIDINKYEVSK